MYFDGNNAVIAFSHFIDMYGHRETFLPPQHFTVLNLSPTSYTINPTPSRYSQAYFFISSNILKHSHLVVCLVIPISGVLVDLFMLPVVSCPQWSFVCLFCIRLVIFYFVLIIEFGKLFTGIIWILDKSTLFLGWFWICFCQPLWALSVQGHFNSNSVLEALEMLRWCKSGMQDVERAGILLCHLDSEGIIAEVPAYLTLPKKWKFAYLCWANSLRIKMAFVLTNPPEFLFSLLFFIIILALCGCWETVIIISMFSCFYQENWFK